MVKIKKTVSGEIEVLRNTVFYVNKCGYHVVWVDYDKRRNEGMFIFEKRICRGDG